MSTPIENNTAGLQEILQQVNDLPEGGVPGNAVLYTEQALTPEQQEQARQNIGASPVNIHTGPNEPTDENIQIWVKTDEEPENVPSKIVQTDWDQKVDTAPDFLKNKPFGYFPTVVLEEQELLYSPEDGGCMGLLSDPIEVGSIVSMVFDGELYEREVIAGEMFNMFGNQSLMGIGEDTGEPFLAGVIDKVIIVVAADEANHTVKLTADVVKRLPDKFASVTKLYINDTSEYIYIDPACTIKAYIRDIPEHSNFSVGYIQEGVIILWPCVLRCYSNYYGAIVGHNSIDCYIGPNTIKTYYTAEYTG